MRQETLAKLAADVIALLEQEGPVVFDRFGKAGMRPLRHNGIPYQGGNAIALWAVAERRRYPTRYWLTFKQALELGGCVRKGEKSSLVLYWDRIKADPDNPEDKGGMFCKTYCVFNAAQCDGLPTHYYAEGKRSEGFSGIEPVEAFVAATGATIREDQSRAFYARRDPRGGGDFIGMPPRDRFADAEAFYATLLHELAHWTGDEKRLARTKGKKFGDDDYALEELTAEICAAMLCGDLGISKAPREDHAHYLASWLRALKSDPRNLWTAGSAADKAAQYLHNLQPKAVADAA